MNNEETVVEEIDLEKEIKSRRKEVIKKCSDMSKNDINNAVNTLLDRIQAGGDEIDIALMKVEAESYSKVYLNRYRDSEKK